MGKRTFILFFTIYLTWKESHACFSPSTYISFSVKPGDTLFRECPCDKPGYTANYTLWLDAGGHAIDIERPGTYQTMYISRNDNQSVSLFVPSMTKGLSGAYKCVTIFEGQTYERVVNVTVLDPITIVNTPEKRNLVFGNTPQMLCEVRTDLHNETEVTWSYFENDIPIELNENEDIVAKYSLKFEKGPNFYIRRVYINNVTMEDKGTYTCSAVDRQASDTVNKIVDVEIITVPVITDLIPSPRTAAVAGQPLNITCMADAIPAANYTFEKIDEATVTSTWTPDGNDITINSITPEDQGTYRCRAQNEAGSDERETYILVLIPPNITDFPDRTVREGNDLQLYCKAEGRPAPNITILFDNEENNTYNLDNNLIDQIFKVGRQDRGTYACYARNIAGEAVEYMNLNVEYEPVFTTGDEIVWGWKGKEANLSCTYDSNPPADLKWMYFKSLDATEQSDPLQELNETYVIFNVSSQFDSYGRYNCIATNPLGIAVKTIKFLPGHVPSIKANTSILSVEQTSATFAIEGPFLKDGPEIQGYTAEYDTEENYNVTHIHINRTWSLDRPYTIEGLESNTTYLIRFAAINEVGRGVWTEFFKFTTPEPAIPSTPEWLTSIDEVNTPEWLTSIDEVNITTMDQEVRWAPAQPNGAAIQYYTLKYCTENQQKVCNEVRVVPSKDLKLDNILMEYNTTYFINLTAHNIVGDSAPANLTVLMLAESLPSVHPLSAGALIGLSIVVVFVCLLLLDLLLLLWRRQGIIASCCTKKKSKAEENLHTRDKKGLLKDNREPEETLSPDNRHKEFEYNKTTGIITGRHSAV